MLLFLLIINVTIEIAIARVVVEMPKSCIVNHNLKEEIRSYQNVTNAIVDYVINKKFKGRTFSELSKFIDKFGPRLSGSDVLEQSIDYMINLTRANDINDVTTEQVKVPHWMRLQESATMLKPLTKNIAVLGLGYSVSTPPDGIIADVVAVESFEELNSLGDVDIKGKIVVYVQKYTTYGETVVYRSKGASEAAKRGAVASLITSVTPFSLYTTHTGMQIYERNVTKIPAAAITIEDAHLIKRVIGRGEKVQLHLLMLNKLEENKISRNTLIDRKGTQYPDKKVIVSGHIDSWDVGTGAMDDGGGMMISWAVPVILKELDLRPKRTVQAILWTGEELGLLGAASYANAHKTDLNSIDFIMESDEGTFTPTGLAVAGSQHTKCIVAEILQLFSSINATRLEEEAYPGSDIVEIVSKGVPGAGLLNKNERYFWYHHSVADTMSVENTRDLDLCAAFWTAVAYVIADLSVDLPRD